MIFTKEKFKSAFEKIKESGKKSIDNTKQEIKERYELAKDERKADISSKKAAISKGRQTAREETARQIEKKAKDRVVAKYAPKKAINYGGNLGSNLSNKKIDYGSSKNNLTSVGLNVPLYGKVQKEQPKRKQMRFI